MAGVNIYGGALFVVILFFIGINLNVNMVFIFTCVSLSVKLG